MNSTLKTKLNNEVERTAGDLQLIVDLPFKFIELVMLDLGVVVLLIEDKKSKTINRIALSNTEPAAGAIRASRKPFHNIKIPLTENRNAIVMAVTRRQKQIITDWKDLFVPELSPQEARDNQNSAGIMCSVVSPMQNGQIRGALIFSFLCPLDDLSDDHYNFIDDFSEIVSKAI